jgi:transposase
MVAPSRNGIEVPEWKLRRSTNREGRQMQITTVGLDLAKNVIQLHAVNQHGNTVLNKALKRNQVLSFFANLTPCLIGMEACGSAHYWARKLQALGHTVQLMAP